MGPHQTKLKFRGTANLNVLENVLHLNNWRSHRLSMFSFTLEMMETAAKCTTDLLIYLKFEERWPAEATPSVLPFNVAMNYLRKLKIGFTIQ